MRTLALFAALYMAATSNAATTTTTSSSKAASSSSAYVYPSSVSCTPGSGGDLPCTTEFGSNYCCYYSWYQYSGQSQVGSYYCAFNPGKESLLSKIVGTGTSLYSDASNLVGSSGYTSGGYCANSVFIETSLALLFLAFGSLFY